jgi:hypothetical protein
MKKHRILEVTVTFEPSRMKDTYLAEAYEMLIPLDTPFSKATTDNVRSSEEGISKLNKEDSSVCISK